MAESSFREIGRCLSLMFALSVLMAACNAGDVPSGGIEKRQSAVFLNSSSWATWTSGDHKFADVNNDGLTDIIGVSGAGTVVVGLSNGGRFLSPTTWASLFTGYDHSFADVNNDGSADLIGVSTGGTDVQVALSTGSTSTGFAPFTSWTWWDDTNYDHSFADVDGDRRADIIGVSRATGIGTVAVGLARTTGNGFAPSTNWTTWDSAYDHSFADVDGDGRADLVGVRQTDGDVQVGLSTVSGGLLKFAPSTRWASWYTNCDHKFADVNGDGKADLIGYCGSQGSNVMVGLSTGSGFLSPVVYSWWNSSYDRAFADVDGDGRADIIGVWGTDVQVGLSRDAGALNGTLTPFGGHDSTCLQVSGNGVQIGSSCSTFIFDGPTIKSGGLCFDILNGDLAGGVLDLTTCNGTVNQQWYISGGQVVSTNHQDGQAHCLDVHSGLHGIGTRIGVAPCNTTSSQSFWISGPTMNIANPFVDPMKGDSECLDVSNDNETAGASIDSANCNSTNAQWFVFDRRNHITLARNPQLCVSLGTPANGVTPTVLSQCDEFNAAQQWYLTNKGFDSAGRPITGIQNRSSLGYLDVLSGSATSGTVVDVTAANTTPAQQWRPIVGGPGLLVNYGAGVLTAPSIYRLYYGSWWNTLSGNRGWQQSKDTSVASSTM